MIILRKIFPFFFPLFFCALPLALQAQLQLVTNTEPQRIFFGENETISVIFQNLSGPDFEDEVRARIFQASSATVVQLGEILWKRLQVLPGQTILESAQLDFPAVKAETMFLVQWLGNSNDILGTTTVLVYPTNLLEELQPLAGGKAIGVFDPQNELKPLLRSLRIDFEDLGNLELENFSGRLAIIGPFQSNTQIDADLAKEIELLAKKGTAVVWIQPPGKNGRLKPSYYAVPEKQVAVMIVQPDLVSDLPGKPQSQLNLIYFCKLALNPQPPTLPDLASQP